MAKAKAKKQDEEVAMTENDVRITQLCERVKSGQRHTKQNAFPIFEGYDPYYMAVMDWLDSLSTEQRKAIGIFCTLKDNANSNVVSALLENLLADAIAI